MSFEVSADAYGWFMARYADPLAVRFADLAAVTAGQKALDVGCGPGALTAELVRRLGVAQVTGAEPSVPFADAAMERFPGLEVVPLGAEELPFRDDVFDVTMAQLVVQFMADPVTGLRQMRRVTKPDGVVTACVWDRGGGRSPTTFFWRVVHELDPAADHRTGAGLGTREGELGGLFEQAGLRNVRSAELTVSAPKVDFEEWWAPLMSGVGPVGDYVLSLKEAGRRRLREHAAELWVAEPDEVSVTAWAAVGLA